MTSLLLHCSVGDRMRSHWESRWCFHFKAESFVRVYCLPNFRQPDERCLVMYICTFSILLLYELRPFQIACCPIIIFHSYVLSYIISILSGPFLNTVNVWLVHYTAPQRIIIIIYYTDCYYVEHFNFWQFGVSFSKSSLLYVNLISIPSSCYPNKVCLVLLYCTIEYLRFF